MTEHLAGQLNRGTLFGVMAADSQFWKGKARSVSGRGSLRKFVVAERMEKAPSSGPGIRGGEAGVQQYDGFFSSSPFYSVWASKQ